MPVLFGLNRRKKIRITAISFVFLLIVFVCIYFYTDLIVRPLEGLNSTPLPGEWPMFRRELEHSGSTSPSSLLPQGKMKWVFPTGGPIHSSPAVANGTIYVGSKDGRLYALDAESGEELWQFETGSWVDSSPAVAKGVVYFGSNDGKLYALQADTGQKLWDFDTEYPIKSSPAVANGIVYFGAGDFYIYAVDTEKGTKIWRFKTGDLVESPAVANGIVYVGSLDNFCYALDATNGRLRLRFQAHSSVSSSPVVKDGSVYFSNSKGDLYAIDGGARNWLWENKLRPYWQTLYLYRVAPKPSPPSGFLWTLSLGGNVNSSPALANGILYIGSDNRLLAIDVESQETKWVFETADIIRSSPALTDTAIFIGSDDGYLYALDVTTGSKLWDINTGDKITSSPAVNGTTVYIGSHDGNLYAIE